MQPGIPGLLVLDSCSVPSLSAAACARLAEFRRPHTSRGVKLAPPCTAGTALSPTPEVPVPSLWATIMSPIRLHDPGAVTVPPPPLELCHPTPSPQRTHFCSLPAGVAASRAVSPPWLQLPGPRGDPGARNPPAGPRTHRSGSAYPSSPVGTVTATELLSRRAGGQLATGRDSKHPTSSEPWPRGCPLGAERARSSWGEGVSREGILHPLFPAIFGIVSPRWKGCDI